MLTPSPEVGSDVEIEPSFASSLRTLYFYRVGNEGWRNEMKRLVMGLFGVLILLCGALPVGAATLLTTHTTNLRADHSAGAKSLRVLYPNEALTLAGSRSHGFQPVETTQGEKGWVWHAHVKCLPYFNIKEWELDIDEDGDCQHTRQEVLIRDNLADWHPKKPEPLRLAWGFAAIREQKVNDIPEEVQEVLEEVQEDRLVQGEDYGVVLPPLVLSDDGCSVVNGKWLGPYGPRLMYWPDSVVVELTVPIWYAYASGGHAWDREKKTRFANDLSNDHHLIAISLRESMKKAAKGPETYRPLNTYFQCTYASAWETIKKDWGLTMSVPERNAVNDMKKTCN